jgi:hypothetical protein
MNYEKAIAVVRERQLGQVEQDEALKVLVEDGMRMRKALQFYANKEHYIDGAPQLKDEEGLLTKNDDGAMARQALRLVDVALPVLMKVERKEAA